MTKTFYPVVFLFLIFSSIRAVDAQSVHYRMRPIPAADRTDLEISLSLEKAGGPLTIQLPTDCYGTPRLSRFVTSFTGEGGTVVTAGKAEDERVVNADPQGRIQLKYALSFDPAALRDNTYSPNVGRDFFHIAGCQWMLRFGKPEEKLRHTIEIVDAPKGWNLYSSLSADPSKFEGVVSFRDIMISAFGGGRGGERSFSVRGKPVSVFIRGKFTIADNEIFEAVRRIVTIQRTRFNDFEQPFYNIVVLPKEGNVAGTRIENLFVSFFKSDVTREELYVLLSHEMLHNWLKTNLVAPPKNEIGLRYQWFYEGFTDYFSRRILLEAGLLSKQKFVELINRDIINIADNPHRSATYADLVDATNTGKFGQAFNKLSYYRGALIALNWDTAIRKRMKGRSLGDLIEEIYRANLTSNVAMTEEAFFEVVKSRYGMDGEADFKRYILQGEPIDVTPDAIGSGFGLKTVSVPSFDPGFALDESRASKKVTGVKASGTAYAAGLRDGMEVVRTENHNRFSNAWNPQKPMVVVVKDAGVDRKISYFPHGSSHDLKLFRSAK